ncbi:MULTISPECIES: hypothetical protein [Streptosporangium]|uniref:Uncharacterized protein n=1 Tax=Streptosporangium brasiliense TaxID=47480 RepID=A0ABT9RG68_9ACTN|nr:hypothetical protein [Streptosporangium brasiliense]MDP9868245.1 hypothetical protein [Streptosporangium brasiliense]
MVQAAGDNLRDLALVLRVSEVCRARADHLIHRVHLTPQVRAGLATVEHDELPDGTHEVGHIEWRDYRTTRDLPIFPPIGPALAAITDAGLPAVTDDNYTWIM